MAKKEELSITKLEVIVYAVIVGVTLLIAYMIGIAMYEKGLEEGLKYLWGMDVTQAIIQWLILIGVLLIALQLVGIKEVILRRKR